MSDSPSSGPPLHPLLRGLLWCGGVALAWLFVRWFALAFGYQPNDANLPLTLALALIVTFGVLAARRLREPDDEADDEDGAEERELPERNEE